MYTHYITTACLITVGGCQNAYFFHKPLAKYKFQMSIQYVVLIHPAYSNLKTIYVYKKLYCLILKYCHSIG